MRNISIDFTKLVFAVFVVCIHTSFLSDFSADLNYFFTQSILRVSVPFFFVVSGYYFFYTVKKEEERKWFVRLLAMHSFWQAVYLYYYWPDSGSWAEIGIELVKRYVEGYLHLWFLMALIGAGIILSIVKNFSSRFILVLAIFIFFMGGVLQYAGNYHLSSNMAIDNVLNKTHVYRNFFFMGFPFFTMGYLFAMRKIKLSRNSLYVALWLGILCLCLEGFLNSTYNVNRESFDILFSLILVVPAGFGLLLLRENKDASSIYSDLSSSVYFIHPLFLFLIGGYLDDNFLLTIVVLGASLFSYFFLIKLKNNFKFIM